MFVGQGPMQNPEIHEDGLAPDSRWCGNLLAYGNQARRHRGYTANCLGRAHALAKHALMPE